MMQIFKKPDFSDKQVELRFENNEICIYGTKDGLEQLTGLIEKLIEKPNLGHIHLEDYEILTKQSLAGAVAIFQSQEKT